MIRDAVAADFDALLALNNSAAPNVNVLERGDLDRIAALACYLRVAEDAEGITGFVLCLPSGVDYWSENYRWFAARYDAFLYLDRVVVAERVRGQGVGAALYADMQTFAAARWPRVTLEVNLRPPNPGSDRFHTRLGYRPVGVRTDGGSSGPAVTMYVRAL